jgi:hypothetical protein
VSTTIAYLPKVRSEESIIRQGVIDLTQFCEREGLDPKWLLGPDPEGFVRKLKADSEARQREEMPRGGKLLQFRA